MRRLWIVIVVMAALGLAAMAAPAAEPPALAAPDHLRTEYLENPLGLDTTVPRFGWWMKPGVHGARQTAYEIQVGRSAQDLAAGLPDCWATEKVDSDASVHVEYAGAPLESFHTYYWRVRIWDEQGRTSPFSKVQSFETALLKPEDFTAAWIRGEKDIPRSRGYHSQCFKEPGKTQLIRLDFGTPKTISAVVLYPASLDGEAGYGFPLRYRVVLCDKESGEDGAVVADCTGADQANPGAGAVTHTFEPRTNRYVRIEVSALPQNKNGEYFMALAEAEALAPENGAVVTAIDADVESRLERHGWSPDSVRDGIKESLAGASHSPLMRKAFELPKGVKRARAYVSGLGYYELYLNGKRVGDRVLDPANTVHHKRTLYSVYDVTHLLKQGKNAAGMMLGHGWWKDTCAAWLQLRVELSDGSVVTLQTDETWRYAPGPIVAESFYHGETYDARLEVPQWSAAGFDDAAWQAVQRFETPPARLAVQAMPPIRIAKTLKPKSIQTLPNGEKVVDFGQNMTGWIQMKVAGPAGTEVVLRHAELLYPDGSLNMENLRAAEATDRYILKGAESETYAPRFTQHGFRYAQIAGYPGELTPDKLLAQVVYTDFEETGRFDCSNKLYNTIRDISRWSILGNNMSMPTDCPQRDERQGWMGDAHLAAEASILNYDFAAYYEQWLRVIADSQSPEGFVPDTAPNIWGNPDGSPPWAIAYPLVVWYSWHYYQNKRVVEEHYDNIARWMATLEAKAKDGILEYCHYGDWVGIEKTPMPPIGTGCYYWTAAMLEDFARVLGKAGDQEKWAAKKAQIATAYNARFFNAEKGYYDEGTQFSQIFPLYLGIAQGPQAEAALKRLKSEIMETRQGHLATGILGTKYLFDVLDDSGNADVAYTLSLKEDYPSWGYMIANGATTVWELWELKTDGGMNSHNHQMFGSILDWMHGRVAGIRKLPEPGYRQFTIAPAIDGPLSHARAHLDTVRGRIESAWRKSGKGFELSVTVPPNTTARVLVPAKGRPVTPAPAELQPLESNAANVIYELGSGKYRFSVK